MKNKILNFIVFIALLFSFSGCSSNSYEGEYKCNFMLGNTLYILLDKDQNWFERYTTNQKFKKVGTWNIGDDIEQDEYVHLHNKGTHPNLGLNFDKALFTYQDRYKIETAGGYEFICKKIN